MADRTPIEWTATVNPDGTRSPGASWNPIRARNKATGKVGWFCTHASDGCRFCYAETFNRRLGTGIDYRAQDRSQVEIFVDEKILGDPLRWRRPRKIFTLSMSDLFGEFIPDEMIDRVFAVLALAPQHTFLVLTKRAQRMRDYCLGASDADRRVWDAANRDDLPERYFLWALGQQGGAWGGDRPWPLLNVWLGISAEDQARADERIPLLLDTPAAKHFVSLEPLLGPIDLTRVAFREFEYRDLKSDFWIDALRGTSTTWQPERSGGWHGVIRHKLSWSIVGGESGRGARPMDPEWARQLRDDCFAADVPYFFKQWGAWHPDALRYKTTDGVSPPPKMRVGKKAAGRLLDGREWNEVPA